MKKNSLTDRFFPKSMRTLPNWILWKLETINGRQTKVPYSALYHGKASSTNPHSWTSFEDAITMFEYSSEYDGLGFVITNDSGIVFIDIDHCINNGEPDERMKDIISQFGNSTFTEYSQSGAGVHIFVKGTIPRSFKNDKQNVEMYSSGRFCAMTGNAIWKTDITANQNALDYVFEEYRTPERKNDYSYTQRKPTASERDILTKARENEKTGSEFSRLYDLGNWSGLESQSNADFRLCVMLAFWCDRDYATIKSLFSKSALCREKWIRREDYQRKTIERACCSCEESYSEYVARKRREEITDYEQFDSEWRSFVRSKSN